MIRKGLFVALTLVGCRATTADHRPGVATEQATLSASQHDPEQSASRPEPAPTGEHEQQQPPPEVFLEADRLMNETLVLMAAMTKLWEGITDESSAKAAAPNLQELARKAAKLKDRAEMIKDKMTGEEQETIKNRYEDAMREAVNRLVNEARRVASLPGGIEAIKALQATP